MGLYGHIGRKFVSNNKIQFILRKSRRYPDKPKLANDIRRNVPQQHGHTVIVHNINFSNKNKIKSNINALFCEMD